MTVSATRRGVRATLSQARALPVDPPLRGQGRKRP